MISLLMKRDGTGIPVLKYVHNIPSIIILWRTIYERK